jgi:simple sugar transport system permease protein
MNKTDVAAGEEKNTAEPTATPAEPKGSRRSIKDRLHEVALVPALIVTFIVGALINPAFLTTSNIVYSILQQSAVLAVVVVAEALILIAGKFDLSLESLVALAPAFAVWLMVPAAAGGSGLGLNPYLGIIVLLAVGALVGLINGLLIVKLKLNAFIVTLAVLILLRGVTLGISGGQTLTGVPAPVLFLGTSTFLAIPVSVWVAGLLFLIAGIVLKYHSIGRSIYAIGGNRDAARAAGIRVPLIIWSLYVLGGILAALAGIMLTGQIASVSPSQGQNLIFSVFAAAVIGGIGLNGGVGSMLGALTGVLLLGTISNILTLSQVPSFWIDASFGAIILAALILGRFTTGPDEESRT